MDMSLLEPRPDTSKSTRSKPNKLRNTISNFRHNSTTIPYKEPEFEKPLMSMDKYFGSNFSVFKVEKDFNRYGFEEFDQADSREEKQNFAGIEEDSDEESRRGHLLINESDEDFVSESNNASTQQNFYQLAKETFSKAPRLDSRKNNQKRSKGNLGKNLGKNSVKNPCKNSFENPKNAKNPYKDTKKAPKSNRMNTGNLPQNSKNSKINRRADNSLEKSPVNFTDHIAFRKTSSNLGFQGSNNTFGANANFHGTRGRFGNFEKNLNGITMQGKRDFSDDRSREREKAIFKAMDNQSYKAKERIGNKRSIEKRFANEESRLYEKYASRFNLTSEERKSIRSKVNKGRNEG